MDKMQKVLLAKYSIGIYLVHSSVAYPGGVLWVLQHPLAPPLQVGLVRKTCYARLTVASSFSETARSNKNVEASARIHARGYYRPCVRVKGCCAHARTLFAFRALAERAPPPNENPAYATAVITFDMFYTVKSLKVKLT